MASGIPTRRGTRAKTDENSTTLLPTTRSKLVPSTSGTSSLKPTTSSSSITAGARRKPGPIETAKPEKPDPTRPRAGTVGAGAAAGAARRRAALGEVGANKNNNAGAVGGEDGKAEKEGKKPAQLAIEKPAYRRATRSSLAAGSVAPALEALAHAKQEEKPTRPVARKRTTAANGTLATTQSHPRIHVKSEPPKASTSGSAIASIVPSASGSGIPTKSGVKRGAGAVDVVKDVKVEEEEGRNVKRARTSSPGYAVEEEVKPKMMQEDDDPFELEDIDVKGKSRLLQENGGNGVEAVDWDDLDQDDVNDPTMVAEYVHEILAYMKILEVRTMPNPEYMKDQPHLQWNMRGILMDWLIEVHHKFRLLPETLFLTTNVVDRFLSARVVSLQKLQLVGLSALFMCAKYEEVICPSVTNFLDLADGGFTEEDILGAEKYVLQTIDFDLSYPNPIHFLRRCSKADNYDIQNRTVAKYLMEISCVDHKLMGASPSCLAAAGTYLARLCLMSEEDSEWNANLTHYSGYNEQALLPTAQLMLNYILDPRSAHDMFFRKYASKKYLKASTYVRDWAIKRWPEAASGRKTAGRELELMIREREGMY